MSRIPSRLLSMSLKAKIISILDTRMNEFTMQEIYKLFPDTAKTTVRGRVYDALGKGILRIGKGLYISSKAIVEYGNSLEIVNRLVDEGDKFDMIFLDIPYQAAGQHGGNRNLFNCDTISPEQFGIFVKSCEKLLNTDTSPLIFMFTSGKTSKSAHDKYIKHISLKQYPVTGTYQKMWNTGNPMNMGKYLMPKENIYIFSRSGKVDKAISELELTFNLVPNLKEYPTAKPYSMIKDLVFLFSKPKHWVLDPFGGSGKILEACLELGRFCHIIDSSERSLNNHLLPILQK